MGAVPEPAAGDEAGARVDAAAAYAAAAGESGAARTHARAPAATRARWPPAGPAQPGTGNPLTARAWTTFRRPARRGRRAARAALRGARLRGCCSRGARPGRRFPDDSTPSRRRRRAPPGSAHSGPARARAVVRARLRRRRALLRVVLDRRTADAADEDLAAARRPRATARTIDRRTALVRYLAAWIGPALALVALRRAAAVRPRRARGVARRAQLSLGARRSRSAVPARPHRRNAASFATARSCRRAKRLRARCGSRRRSARRCR